MSLWQYLDNPVIWEATRIGLDLSFGLYQKKIRLMRNSGLLDGSPSVLDIGCGIGQYSGITDGDYLGVDMNDRYIEYAKARKSSDRVQFRSQDVARLLDENRQFDLVIMIDFLHHLSDDQCQYVLTAVSKLARKHVVSIEPITQQPRPVGRWIVEHDRGDYVRPLRDLHRLFEVSPLEIDDSRDIYLGPIRERAILCRM